MNKIDIAIVGGGIIGLAHAVAAVEKGYSVQLFEQEEMAVGASVRNFGLVWPIGQPAGNLYDRTMKSREKWLEMSKKANFWALENGSFHLAYQDDEYAVLSEYHTKFGNRTQLLSATEVLKKSPNVNPENLKGGLFSDTEVNVNPKRAIHSICNWLALQPKCTVNLGEKVLSVDGGLIITSKGTYHAEQVFICGGSDFQSLYPEVFNTSGLIKSKLQMMRSKSRNEQFILGPTLCGGLTLRHYASFAQCDSLEVYRNRITRESPEFDKWGIHVMVSQNEYNELVIGDSHEYALSFDPFDKSEINDHIINYMHTFLKSNNIDLLETWHGVYAKNPNGTEFVSQPEAKVKIITGFGGAGMTFSFGYALEEIAKL